MHFLRPSYKDPCRFHIRYGRSMPYSTAVEMVRAFERKYPEWSARISPIPVYFKENVIRSFCVHGDPSAYDQISRPSTIAGQFDSYCFKNWRIASCLAEYSPRCIASAFHDNCLVVMFEDCAWHDAGLVRRLGTLQNSMKDVDVSPAWPYSGVIFSTKDKSPFTSEQLIPIGSLIMDFKNLTRAPGPMREPVTFDEYLWTLRERLYKLKKANTNRNADDSTRYNMNTDIASGQSEKRNDAAPDAAPNKKEAKMKKVVMNDKRTGDKLVSRAVIKELEKNGTYLPPVQKVLFNLKTENKVKTNVDGKVVTKTEPCEPILTTKVWWADGTTTTVKNTGNDKITLDEVTVDGQKVTVASEESKTIGLVYACVKRTCGVPNEKGEMVGTNFSRILQGIVKGAFDQRLEGAKAKAANLKRKAEHEARQAKAAKKPRAKRYTQKDLLQLMGPILEAMAAQLTPEAVLEKVKAELEKEKGAEQGA